MSHCKIIMAYCLYILPRVTVSTKWLIKTSHSLFWWQRYNGSKIMYDWPAEPTCIDCYVYVPPFLPNIKANLLESNFIQTAFLE